MVHSLLCCALGVVFFDHCPHQYMVLLGISGISLFSVSVVALSVPSDFQAEIFTKAWAGLSSDKKATIQDRLGCCGFNDVDKDVLECEEGHPLCNTTVLTAKGVCYT